MIKNSINKIQEKSNVSINPSHMCEALGGVYATIGIENAIPLIHGATGCATYTKFLLSHHFKEPIEIATTGIDEIQAIQGGLDTLIKAIENITSKNSPDLITVLTTGLSETMGDDIFAIYAKLDKQIIESSNTHIALINTPSFKGTHITGYDKTITGIVECVIEDVNYNSIKKKNLINLIPGIVNPGSVRELKKMFKEMGIEYNILTDISMVHNLLRIEKSNVKLTTIENIKDAVNVKATISFGMEGISCAKYLESLGIKSLNCKFPIGIELTDSFLSVLSDISNNDVSDLLVNERYELIDTIINAHDILRGKRIAIYGDPDKVIGLTNFAFEMGLIVAAVLTNTKSNNFVHEIESIVSANPLINSQIAIFEAMDLYTLRKFIKENPIDLLIGDFRGITIANDLKIPLFRIGFPIIDRIGYYRKSMLGYRGAIDIVEDLSNMILCIDTS